MFVFGQEVVFQVENVQLYNGYAIHVGTVVETIKPGDNLVLYLNKVKKSRLFYHI